MFDGILHQSSESLRGMVALIPDSSTHSLLTVALASFDLRLHSIVIFLECRLELPLVVVGSNHHVASLMPVRIESIVLQYPSPH